MSDLRERISAAVNSITPDILHSVWLELDYRLDVSRVTGDAHIECM